MLARRGSRQARLSKVWEEPGMAYSSAGPTITLAATSEYRYSRMRACDLNGRFFVASQMCATSVDLAEVASVRVGDVFDL